MLVACLDFTYDHPREFLGDRVDAIDFEPRHGELVEKLFPVDSGVHPLA